MQWSDAAIVLSARAHGESDVILEALTRDHGRYRALVRGGGSRRLKPLLQPGNSLTLQWRARLADHLGSFTAELDRARAGALMEDRARLIGLNAFTSMASIALPEREPHAALFEASLLLLAAMMAGGFADWAPLYVRWEAGLLDELGFGLDLSACAATGATLDLTHVSPKSGRAVSAAAAAPYHGRLLALPAFLLASHHAVTAEDVAAGLGLTGHFLLDRVLAPHHIPMPAARLRLAALASAESA